MENKISITNMVDSMVGIYIPELMIRKEFPRKGSQVVFERDKLEEAYFYSEGLQRMFEDGTLYTDDMDFKKAVGLEPEDATEPVNILKLDEKLLSRIIKYMPVTEVEDTLKKLTSSQLSELANYAVDHYENLSMDRINIIGNACNRDLLNAIKLRKESKED